MNVIYLADTPQKLVMVYLLKDVMGYYFCNRSSILSQATYLSTSLEETITQDVSRDSHMYTGWLKLSLYFEE